MRIIDSHCHLNILQRRGVNPRDVLTEAQAQSVVGMLNISVELSEMPELIAQAQLDPNIWVSAGIHPCHCENFDTSYDALLAASDSSKVIAIGESGLDFFHAEESKSQHQHPHFLTHIEVAKARKLPIIIHCRNAATQVIQTLQQHAAQDCGGVMHCFVEDYLTAKAALDLGFYISFSGILTFPKSQPLRDVAAQIPLERLLVETDAPYLSPAPHRSKMNQPAYVRHTLETLAQVHNLSIEEMAEITTENFEKCFSLRIL